MASTEKALGATPEEHVSISTANGDEHMLSKILSLLAFSAQPNSSRIPSLLMQTPQPRGHQRHASPHSKRPDHNQHVNDSSDESPMWYRENTAIHPIDHPDYLCATCRRIDLAWLFFDSPTKRTAAPEEYIKLGTIAEMVEETTCALCRIVVATILLRIRLGIQSKAARLADEQTELLMATWYLSPFVYSHEQYPVGWQLFLRHNVFDQAQMDDTTHLLPSHPFALRLITDRPRGGRRIPFNTLDFSWIRTTIELCDLSTEMPPHEFDPPIRVVDVEDMCIVEMTRVADYVALSYPWGRVNQLRLNKQTEPTLRQRDGIVTLFDDLARTIQDAIILVQQIGQRYLWVDSLSIIQDDEADVKQQMDQMGDIYRYSYFTIFAISGEDANYGLPGVRQNSRNLKQTSETIRGLTVANSLPWMEDDDLPRGGAWGTRAWTYQERFHSQRGVFIGENGMIINCLHIFSPEDEHCWHSLTRDENQLATGSTYFFTGQDKRSVPYIRHDTPFDLFAQFVYEYTMRKLTYQSDALPAFLGVLKTAADRLECIFLHGTPETEFDAGLLWSPLGVHKRRPEYPSWSWLGWIGCVAYPWTHERDTFLSTEHSPLEWLDGAVAQANRQPLPVEATSLATSVQRLRELEAMDYSWFTSEDLCLPAGPGRHATIRHWLKALKQTDDYLGIRRVCEHVRDHAEMKQKYNLGWQDDIPPFWTYLISTEEDEFDRCLTFRTLTVYLYVVGQPFEREKLYNMQYPIWRRAVCDEMGHLVGYIDIPDPESEDRIEAGRWKFVAMSRSTIDGNFDPPPDPLEARRLLPVGREPANHGHISLQEIEELVKSNCEDDNINEVGGFDKTVYDEKRPWCMFNVLMLREHEHRYCRAAIGRVHVDAFLAHGFAKEVIELV